MININYLTFDKKLMQAEQEEEDGEGHHQDQQSTFVKFLKLHVLAPLKTMLMYENRS